MLLSLQTLGIKPDVRRLFVHDNRMFAERAFYCYTEKFFVDIINMTYSCRVVLDMICMESGIMKIDRLIGILSILLQEEKTTAPELAEKFEVSRRTINRDIEDLCKAGIPIRTAQGTGGGISLMDGYRMDRTILTSKDMQMILAGLRSLDSVSGNRYYGRLMEKILTGSSEFISGRDSMLIDLSLWYKGSLAPKIEVIQNAIENRHTIQFMYYAPSGDSNRRIEPYYLVFRWSSWYVWGWCLDREDYRLFKSRPLEVPAQTGAPIQRRLWVCRPDTTPSWGGSCGLADLSAVPSIAADIDRCASILSGFYCRSTSSLPDPKYHREEQDHSLSPPAIGSPAVDNIPGSPAL